MSTTNHPKIDGQTESNNKAIKNYLRCFIGDCPKDWSNWVPLPMWWYNSTQPLSTRLTSFEAICGFMGTDYQGSLTT